MITYHQYIPGRKNHPMAETAASALMEWLKGESDAAYAQMMIHRLSGTLADESEDRYFIAMDSKRCISRLWFGWGRHSGCIGNFGNFRTAEEYRGKGIGHQLMQMLLEDLRKTSELPLALFCTAEEKHLAELYGKWYGFRPVLKGMPQGPLYCPLNDSPADFHEFCRRYYQKANELHFKPGGIGYRHEIDCLLAFTLCENREYENFGLKSFPTYESAWLAVKKEPSCGKLERIETECGIVAGWAFTSANGKCEIQLHLLYHELVS